MKFFFFQWGRSSRMNIFFSRNHTCISSISLP